MNTYLAADFGGGSGRVISGTIIAGKLILEEIHRFENRQIKLGVHTYWDFLSLFQEMKIGMRKAAQKGITVSSIGIDTWGVDFGLIDAAGNLLGNPYSYRDTRTDGMPEQLFKTLNATTHYAQTGIQVMSINTLFQLYCMKCSDHAQLKVADKLLFMPDLFSYFLTGVANNEYCIASTSELLDARKRTWAKDLINTLQLPAHLFGDIVSPGTVRGTLKSDIAQETGLGEIDVIAVGSHDTASAIVAVPSLQENVAFLSSGTWSLLGMETDEPILTEEARQAGFTNEGGVGGKIRFLQNITGLWILQCLMKEWKEQGEEIGYTEIINQASTITFQSVIDVDDLVFVSPKSMEKTVREYCLQNNLPVPEIKVEFVRCIIESLAIRYKKGVDQMNRLLPTPVSQLHIIGGGSQNGLLNQLTANALGIPVYAGPVEATAIGNILTQAWTKGELSSRAEIREVVIAGEQPLVYYPKVN